MSTTVVREDILERREGFGRTGVVIGDNDDSDLRLLGFDAVDFWISSIGQR